MKYFTKEELDFIADELANNPSKETIKKLNDKFNGDNSESKIPTWVETNPLDNPANIERLHIMNNNVESKIIKNEDNTVEKRNKEVEAPKEINSIYRPGYEQLNTPVWKPINNTENNIYNSNLRSQINTSEVNNNNIPSIPNLNIQSEPVNVKENISNFNNIPNLSIPNLSIPSINGELSGHGNSTNNNNVNNHIPFDGNPWETKSSNYNSMMQTTDNFNSNIESSPNPNSSIEPMPFFQIGVNTQGNQIPVSESPKDEGPTMLEQFEQNYNNKATQ